MKLIRSIMLAAESTRRARYELQIFELAHGEGYVIAKNSGPEGSIRVSESWYRPSLDSAERKYEAIISLKTGRSKGRKYHQINDDAELCLSTNGSGRHHVDLEACVPDEP